MWLEGRNVLVSGSASFAKEISAALAAEGARVLDDAFDNPVDSLLGIEELDVLIDVGGAFSAKPFVNVSEDEWREVLHDNVVRAARNARRTLPGMLLRERGVVVFLLDPRGAEAPWNRIPQEVTYHARASLLRELKGFAEGSDVVVASVTSEMLVVAASPGKSQLARKHDGFVGDRFVAYLANLLGPLP